MPRLEHYEVRDDEEDGEADEEVRLRASAQQQHGEHEERHKDAARLPHRAPGALTPALLAPGGGVAQEATGCTTVADGADAVREVLEELRQALRAGDAGTRGEQRHCGRAHNF